jgi:superfamily II DNA or RNA helicase
VLRPKPGENYAYFYSVVTKDTKDQECAKKRSTFLTEQGYRYRLIVLDDEATGSYKPELFESEASRPVYDSAFAEADNRFRQIA